MDSAGLSWNARGEALPLLSGEDVSVAARGAVRGPRRVGDRDALSPRGARGRRPRRIRLRRRVLRVLRGRGPVAAPGPGGLAVRLRSASDRPPRGVAHRTPHTLAARLLDGAQSLAHALPQLRARPDPRAIFPRCCGRIWPMRAPSALAAWCCRCSSGRGCRGWPGSRPANPDGCRRGRGGPRTDGWPASDDPRDHRDPRLLERCRRGPRSRRIARRGPRANPRGRRRACRSSSSTTAEDGSRRPTSSACSPGRG